MRQTLQTGNNKNNAGRRCSTRFRLYERLCSLVGLPTVQDGSSAVGRMDELILVNTALAGRNVIDQPVPPFFPIEAAPFHHIAKFDHHVSTRCPPVRSQVGADDSRSIRIVDNHNLKKIVQSPVAEILVRTGTASPGVRAGVVDRCYLVRIVAAPAGVIMAGHVVEMQSQIGLQGVGVSNSPVLLGSRVQGKQVAVPSTLARFR